MKLPAILETLDLTDDTQRYMHGVIQRMHDDVPVFQRMLDMQRNVSELIELAEWYHGGFAVVRWSLTEIKFSWRTFATLEAARAAFEASVPSALPG